MTDEELDLDAIRRELESRRDSTSERVATLAERPELGSAQGFGKRIGDGTTEAISRITEIGVGRSLETGLARTERALAKLDEGTYGTCDACGETIPPKRLRAMPDSVLCVRARRPSASSTTRAGAEMPARDSLPPLAAFGTRRCSASRPGCARSAASARSP